MKIAAISSRKVGNSYEGGIKNSYLYNGKELFDDADLNWYDYGFRNYDPQIGRFPQLDPLTNSYPLLTPYQYASCDPITNIDIDGLEGYDAVVRNMTGYLGKADNLRGLVNGINTVERIASPTIAGLNFVVNVINTTSQQSIIKQQLAINSINGGFTTQEVGLRDRANNDFHKPFDSPDEAAIDWGKKYNDNSISDGHEYASIIYKLKNKYYYTTPNRGTPSESWPTPPRQKGADIVARIHSHSNASGLSDGAYRSDNDFSGRDERKYIDLKVDGYVSTPNGSLLKYDHKLRKAKEISTQMPSDTYYPSNKRKNNLDFDKFPKGEFYTKFPKQ